MAKRVSLFNVLRRELVPFLTGQGFAEVPQEKSEQNHILLFFREASQDKSVGFWIQRDVKANYVDALGSSFTIEFFKSLDKQFVTAERERFSQLLDEVDREEFRQLQNKMIKRLPPLEQVLEPREIENEIRNEWVNEKLQLIKKPLEPSDIWMRYRDEEDLLGWTKFSQQHFPAWVERFLLTMSK